MGSELNDRIARIDECSEIFQHFFQLCPSSQASQTAGLPPDVPPDSALQTRAETGRGQQTQKQTGVHNVSKSTSQITVDVNRCLQISLRQGMKTDTGTLMSLCEKTDNDIRACINTLQVAEEASLSLEPVSCTCRIYITLCVLVCTVPSWPRPQAGGRQDHPVCFCGTEGPEQRLVPSVAGDLPVTTNQTVQSIALQNSSY